MAVPEGHHPVAGTLRNLQTTAVWDTVCEIFEDLHGISIDSFLLLLQTREHYNQKYIKK